MDKSKVLQVNVRNFEFYADPVLVWIDGVSDTSEYASMWATHAINFARERLISILKFQKITNFTQLNEFLNFLLGLIPDEIDIPHSDWYI